MVNKGIFVIGEGFYFNNKLVALFEPVLKKIICCYDEEEGIQQIRYFVSLTLLDGTVLECKEVSTLKDIPYFKLWRCPDSLLSNRQKKILEFKLQMEAGKIVEEKIYYYSAGCKKAEENIFMVWADKVFGYKGEKNIQIKNPQRIHGEKEVPMSLSNISQKLILLWPGVTEMIFYGSIFATISPLLSLLGYKANFMIALIGPSGHLKTTLIRKYALWLENQEEQEITFRDYGRFENIINRIDQLVGQNFLADDLHAARSRESAQRQEERLDILTRHISTNKCCAQVILTGESLEDRGIFSCIDRILQIKISKMDSKELAKLKSSIDTAGFEYMPYIALKFVETIVENLDDVRNDVKLFFEANNITDKDCSLRISQHALYLKLTEMLYCKYMLDLSKVSSCREQLNEAIENNYDIQRKELLRLRSDEEQDIIVEIYNMLNSPHSNILSNRNEYMLQDISDYTNGISCLFEEGKIYITRNAMQIGMNRYLGKTCHVNKIAKALHNAGLLVEDVSSRTKKLENIRHYVISHDLLRQYVQLKNM